MRERLLNALRYLLERLQEPTTRAGAVIVATGLIGVEAKSVNVEVVGGVVALAAGTLLMLVPSSKL